MIEIGTKVKIRKDSPRYKEQLYSYVQAEGVVFDILTTSSKRTGKVKTDYIIYSEEWNTSFECKIGDFEII